MVEQPRATGTLEELRQELEAAEAAVAAFGPSPEQLREEAAKAEQLAKESGMPAKSAAVIRQLERRWREFLDAHGEAYGYEEAAGPTIELAVHFQVRDGARGRLVGRRDAASSSCRMGGGSRLGARLGVRRWGGRRERKGV